MMKTLLFILLTTLSTSIMAQPGSGWNRQYGDSITIMGTKFQIRNVPAGILTDSLLSKKANGNVTRIAINQLPFATSSNVYNAGTGLTKTGSEPNATFVVDQSQVMMASRAADSIANINTKVNGKANKSLVLSVGFGLNGGGDLSANRSFAADTSSGGLATKANSFTLAQLQSRLSGYATSASVTSALASKQNTITLTTTGTSGAATLIGNNLNIPNYSFSSPVSSVFGRTGAVIAVSGDYNTSQVTENTNLYFTNARARSAISALANGGITYNLSTGEISKTTPTYNNAPSITLNTSKQISTTRPVRVTYSIRSSIQLALVIGAGTVRTYLEISPNNSTWTTISSTGFTESLTVAVATTRTQDGNVQGEVPIGYWVRLRTEITQSILQTGTTITYLSGQEIID